MKAYRNPLTGPVRMGSLAGREPLWHETLDPVYIPVTREIRRVENLLTDEIYGSLSRGLWKR